MVYVFKQQFSVFKQHFTHFNALFHPHVFPQMFSNNNFQFLNTYTKRPLNNFKRMLFTKKFPTKLLFSKFCLIDAKRHFCTSLRKKICPTVYKILAQSFQRVLNIKDAMRLGSSYFMFLSSLFLFSLFHLTEPLSSIRLFCHNDERSPFYLSIFHHQQLHLWRS